MFLHLSVSHSVHGGGGSTPQDADCPGDKQTPLPDVDPLGWVDPPGLADPPGCRPPGFGKPPWMQTPTPGVGQTPCRIRSTSGRYASYWNAYL